MASIHVWGTCIPKGRGVRVWHWISWRSFAPFSRTAWCCRLINRRQVRADGFRTLDSGAVEMDETTRKEVLSAWQKRKQEEVQHPFIDEQAPVGLFPHLQALLLARHLRGDLDAYPALIWR